VTGNLYEDFNRRGYGDGASCRQYHTPQGVMACSEPHTANVS
jgi:hypothetical protein